MELLSSIRRNLLLRPFRAVVIDDYRTWKGIELMVASWHIARAIERNSTAPRIGVMLPTSGMFPASAIAAWTLGRTIVPLNYLLSRSDLEYVARDAGIDCLVTVGPMMDLVGGPLPGVAEVRLDKLKFTGLPPIRMTNPLKRDDLAVVLYTSGTSGRPKGVMLTCGNLSANARQIQEWVGFGPADRVLGVLPQFHSFGLTVLTMLPLATGASAIYTARFIPRKLVELARTHKPTAFVAGQAGVTLGSVEIERKHVDSAGYAVRKAAGFLTGAESQRAHSYAARCFDGAGLTILADGERVAAGEPPSTPTPILTPAITPATSPAPTMTEPRLRVGPESKPKVAEIAPIRYSIQIGAYSTVEKAHAAAEKLAARCTELHIDAPRVIARENSDGSTLHFVQLGDFENRGVASKMLLKFPRSAFKIEVYLAGIDQSE